MHTRYSNIVDLLNNAFSTYAHLPAYTCMGCTKSFKEIEQKSAQFASYLQHELGLKKGDRFAIQMPNTIQLPIALYGAMRAGIVVVNINPLYTPRELLHQLNDSGAKALLVLANVAHNAAEIIEQTGVENVIVSEVADEHPWLKRRILNFAVRHVKKMIPKYRFQKSIKYGDVFKKALPDFFAPEIEPNDILVLQYTGGTTGVSKGAILTHHNLASNVWQVISHMPDAFRDGEEVFVACLPLYHIYALNLHALASFSRGAHNILIPNPRDLDALTSSLKNTGFTIFVGINTLFRALVRHSGFRTLNFSSLKITSAGGMALTEDAAKAWSELTECEVIEGYGLTETSPVLTGNQKGNIQIGTIGVPLCETEIKILDNEGQEVPKGQAGELCARGPQVMPGYWQREDDTQSVFTQDGFFKTGDIAVCLDQGFYKIVDRKKDLILVSGFNVYPNEVEDVLTSHPDIVEAAAVGIPDDDCGEVVKVFLVRETPELSEQEIKQFCKENLTPYKVPKLYEFREELPKSNVGKILRRELRE